MKQKKSKEEWFRNAGFGMFIHWGVYSVIGKAEWAKFQEKIPDDEYWSYAPKFKAQKFDPDSLVSLAKEAGMKYMVMTTKHHDGYCLFKTKTTKLNCLQVGPQKDLVAAFVKACHKQKMRVGLYYSLPDWSKPEFFIGPDKDPVGWKKFIKFTHAQVKEIMSNYGKIDVLWYDNILAQSGNRHLNAEDYQSKKLNRMVRKLQPEILINDRSLLPEDFYTAEQHPNAPEDKNRLWEACMTMNKHWGYFPADQMWKTPAEIVHIMTGIASSEGNLLLNVGPRADGSLPKENIQNLKAAGKWLNAHGDAIYGANRCPMNGGTFGLFTRKGDVLYAVVHWWHGKKIVLPEFPYSIKKAWILNTGDNVSYEYDGKRVILKGLPTKAPDPLCSVIALKVDSKKRCDTTSEKIAVNFREG